MPANTAIIGRVAVKVLPDTNDFRKNAERKLNEIEKRLPPMEVHTKIDMSGASRGYLEELRTINSRNRQSDARKIRFHAIISTDGMNEAISRAVRQLNERAASRKIKLDADLVAAVASLELDPKALKAVRKQLEDFRRAHDPLKIQVKVAMTPGAASSVSTRLTALTRDRVVRIVPVLDNAALASVATALSALSGFRLIHGMFDNMARSIGHLDEAVPKIAGVSLGLGALSGAALTSTSNILALGGSIAALSGLLIPLPVLIGSTIVAFIALRTAFEGFSDAVKNGGKDLAKLPPQMRAAAEAVRSFKIAKGPIQEAFWNGLAASIIKVRETAFPSFLKGLLDTATALNGFAKALLDAIAAVKPKVFDSIFSGFTQSIDVAKNAMAPLVNAFATLGLVGATYLPRLAQWFVDINTQFDKFLTRTAADGSLVRWVEGGVQAAKELGGVIKGLFGIFGGLANAAKNAGGSTLGILSETLNNLSNAVNSSGFQKRLTELFDSAHAGFENLSNAAGPGVSAMFKSLSETLSTLLPRVGHTIGVALGAIGAALAQPEVGKSILAMFDGIDKAITALAPAMGRLALALASILPVIGSMASNFGPLLATAITGISEAVTILAPKVEELIPHLTAFLNQALVPIVPAVKLAAEVIGALVGPLGGVLDVLSPLIPVLVSALGVWLLWTNTLKFAKLIVSIGETIFIMGLYAASAVSSAFTASAAWLASFAQTIAIQALYVGQAIAGAASTAAAWVASAARTVASLVATAAGYVVQGAIIVASMAVTVASVVAGWVLMAAQAMLAAARIAIAWLIMMGPIALIIAAVVGLVVIIVKNWETIKNAIASAATFVLNFLKKNWPYILAILTGPIGAAVLVITRNWDKIKAGASAVKDFLVDKFVSVVSFFASLPGRMSSSFSGMFDGLKDSFRGAVNFIIDKWNGLSFKIGGGKVFGKDLPSVTINTPNIPRLASGAFVKSRPGGILANIGEGSLNEMVLPLPPGMKPKALSKLLGDLASGEVSSGPGKVFNYYAAPNQSLSAEEDLFAASDRARMVGW